MLLLAAIVTWWVQNFRRANHFYCILIAGIEYIITYTKWPLLLEVKMIFKSADFGKKYLIWSL